MWTYSKKLEYPVKIAHPNAAAAISQLGGPNPFKILFLFETAAKLDRSFLKSE